MNTAEELQRLYRELEQAAVDLPLASKPEDIVPGEGHSDAEVFLIGEAPGYHESVQRRPFVGRSGKLLRSVLGEIGLPPETVYIGNIVKVRPPDNRDPSAQEILAYKPFLDREIEILQPKLIVTLGRFSMAKFLPEVKISQVHGRLHKVSWQGDVLYVLPMYHPAAALRGTKIKESFVADMSKIPKVLKWLSEQEQHQAFTSSVEDALF